MDIKTLKKDLRSYTINKKYYENLVVSHKKNMIELQGIGYHLSDVSIEELQKIFNSLLLTKDQLMDFKRNLKKVAFYTKCIRLLPIADQNILFAVYFEGKPYWKVGQELHYSEEGIRKKLSKQILPALCKIVDLKSKDNEIKMEDLIMALAYKNVYKLVDGKLVKNKENHVRYTDPNGKSRIRTNPTYDDFIKNGWYPLKHDETIPQYDPKTHTIIDNYVQESDHILCTHKIVEIDSLEEE